MTPRYNSEDEQWHWWSDDTGWGAVLTDAEKADAQAKGQIPPETAGQGDFVSKILANLTGTETWRKKNPDKAGALDRWNNALPEGAKRLSDWQGEQCEQYLAIPGLTWEQALNLGSAYFGGAPNAASPESAAAIATSKTLKPDEMQHEIDRMLAAAGKAPAGAAVATTTPPQALTPEQQKYWDQAIRVAQEKGLPDPGAFARLLLWESRLNPAIVNEKSGAAGIAQFMPGTAASYGIDPLNPDEAIPAAAQLLLDNRAAKGIEDWRAAYAAYFYGAGGIVGLGPNWEQNMDPDYRGELNFVMGGTGGGGAAPGAAGTAGLGYAGAPYAGAPARRTLMPDEENDYTLNYAPRGVSRAAYVTAKDTGRNPLDVQNQINFTELNQALESKWITADEFNFALAYGLSLGDIRQMQTMGISQEEAAPGLVRGLTISDLGAARLLDVPVTDYIWARSRGLTDADIRDAVLSGQSVAEKVAQVKTTAAQGQAQAEFEDIWAKRTAGISEGILNVPGVTPALTREGARAQTEYVRRRTTELATAALEQPVPGAAAKPEPLPSETGIPSTEELLTRVARGGVVPLFVEGREPLPGGFRPSERAVARTGPGGPAQVAGFEWAGKPGGMYGFNPLGDWFAQQQMKAAFGQQTQEQQAKALEGEKYAQAYIGTLGPLTPKTEPLPGEEPKKKKEKLGLAAIS
jgi:hypothetical protein